MLFFDLYQCRHYKNLVIDMSRLISSVELLRTAISSEMLILIDYFIQVRWIALTATANPVAEEDILKQLKLENVKQFKASTFRANLYYDVVIKDLIPGSPEVSLV